MSEDKQLEVLHDHYKETFARLREAEAARDHLFLWVICLFAVLTTEIGYPAEVGGSLGKLTIIGAELNIQALPLPALLNITWVLVLTIGLRYCQTSVLVNRQYPYLHALEDAISPKVGGDKLYRREGQVYLNEYPLLLDVAWYAYSFLFPIIIIFATVFLIRWEIQQLLYPFLHMFFDVVIALAFLTFIFLYRVHPALVPHWGTRKKRDKQVVIKKPSVEENTAPLPDA